MSRNEMFDAQRESNERANAAPKDSAKTPLHPFLAMLQNHSQQIKAALPDTFSPDRMIRLATTEFRMQPKLAKCTPQSVFGSVVQAAQLGLDFSLGHCFLVPYNRSIKLPGGGWEKSLECQLIISFRGYIELARRSGKILNVDAHVVYSNDLFEYEYGTNPHLRHRPTLSNRGDQVAAYCVATFDTGERSFDIMPWEEIQKIKERSKSRDGKGNVTGPWATDEDEMARKTAVRRCAKYWPLSVELRRAVELDQAVAAGVSQNLNNPLEIAKGSFAQISYGDDDDEQNESQEEQTTTRRRSQADDMADALEAQYGNTDAEESQEEQRDEEPPFQQEEQPAQRQKSDAKPAKPKGNGGGDSPYKRALSSVREAASLGDLEGIAAAIDFGALSEKDAKMVKAAINNRTAELE